MPYTILLRHLINTADKSVYASIQCLWYTQCRPTHPIPFQCWASVATHCPFNADQSYSTLAKQNWVIVRVCSGCHTGDTLPPKGHYPDNTIHWPNCEIMLSHRLRRFQPKPFKPLKTNIFVTIFFSEDFLNTKVGLLNLGT